MVEILLGQLKMRVPHRNFNYGSRTTLINGNLVYRNIDFGDGLLSSTVMSINGVETIQVAPKPYTGVVKK